MNPISETDEIETEAVVSTNQNAVINIPSEVLTHRRNRSSLNERRDSRTFAQAVTSVFTNAMQDSESTDKSFQRKHRKGTEGGFSTSLSGSYNNFIRNLNSQH